MRILLMAPSAPRPGGPLDAFLAGHQVEIWEAGSARPAPGPGEAAVVCGPLELLGPEAVRAAARGLERGAHLVVFGPLTGASAWFELVGARVAQSHPAGEYFAKLATAGPLTARLPAEVAFVGAFTELDAGPPGGGPVGAGTLEPVASVSIGYRDRAVIAQRAVGRGQALACGLDADTALASPELRRLIERALRPADPQLPAVSNVAVLGYGPFGGMGYYHGTAITATPGLEFVATCDSSPERCKAAEADFPGVRAYGAPDELAADGDIDVVIIATPPVHHAELALAMLRAGKHVACEKPLCLTVAEADLLIRTAAEQDRCLTVHQNRRWDPDFLTLQNATARGLLGEVFNMETFVGGFEHPCRAWHSEVSVSGGAVYDWGSHHIDWILQIMGGAPAMVQTQGHKRVWHDVTNLDQLRVRMTWPDGREAEFLQSDVAAVRRPKFYVQGTAGTLAGHYRPLTFERIEPGTGYVAELAHHAEAPVELLLARYESGLGITETRLPPSPAPAFPFHRNLADHLLLGEPLAVTPDSVRRVIAVLEAAQRSSDEGNVAITLGA